MKNRILAVGVKVSLISWGQSYFAGKGVELRIALDINEAAHILGKEIFHTLVLDMDYLRSIGQSGWLLNFGSVPNSV